MNISEPDIVRIIAEEHRKQSGEEPTADYCTALATRFIEYIKGRALLAILDQIGIRPESPSMNDVGEPHSTD
jgi:hypothetical protein